MTHEWHVELKGTRRGFTGSVLLEYTVSADDPETAASRARQMAYRDMQLVGLELMAVERTS